MATLPPLQLEQMLVQQVIDAWEEAAHKLPDKQRRECMRMVRQKALEIMGNLGLLLSKGSSRTDLGRIAKESIAQLNASVSSLCRATPIMGEFHAIDARIATLDPGPSYTVPAEDMKDSLFTEIFTTEATKRIEDLLGKRRTTTLETLFEGISGLSSKESESPIRDQVVSLGTHVGMMEAAAAVSKRVPVYAIIGGAHTVAAVARTVEPKLQHFLDTHTAEEYALPPDVMRCCGGEEYLNLYQAAIVAKVVVQGAQLPSDGINSVHHFLADTAGQVLDAVGLTDAAIRDAAIWLVENPPAPNVMLP